MSAAQPDGGNAKRKWARKRASGTKGIVEAGGLGPGGWSDVRSKGSGSSMGDPIMLSKLFCSLLTSETYSRGGYIPQAFEQYSLMQQKIKKIKNPTAEDTCDLI